MPFENDAMWAALEFCLRSIYFAYRILFVMNRLTSAFQDSARPGLLYYRLVRRQLYYSLDPQTCLIEVIVTICGPDGHVVCCTCSIFNGRKLILVQNKESTFAMGCHGCPGPHDISLGNFPCEHGAVTV